jgi:membrane-associated phospholipid phosphatase
MRITLRYTAVAALLALGFGSDRALAQSAGAPEKSASRCGTTTAPGVASLITGTARGFTQLPSRTTFGVLAFGIAGSAAARAADTGVEGRLSNSRQLHETFEAGAFIGSTPFQLTSALTTYAVARATSSPCAALLGADLVRAQLMAETMTIAIKQAFRRDRPEGSGYSFPSGHTTVSFASATVLQQHFGWKVGAPAYAAAAYVAASRVQMRRHYLSDVAFGAALGIISGRTIAFGHSQRFVLEPTFTAGGAGAAITWSGR